MQVFLLFNKGIFFCILLKVKTQQLFISYPNIKTLFKQPNILIGLSCGQCFTANITVSQKLLCWLRTQHAEGEWNMLWNSCGLDTLVLLLPPKSPVSESLHRDRAERTGANNTSFQEVFNSLFCQRLIWLLLATQDMGASQSSVCQVSITNTNCWSI